MIKITGEIKSKVDSLWESFWTGGFPFVSRVIAGYKTDAAILSQLKEICDKKGIELLVQINDELKSELQYVRYAES